MNILFTTDFTEASNHAFVEAAKLFKNDSNTFYILHAHTEDHPHSEEEMKQMLEELAATMPDAGEVLFENGEFKKVVGEVINQKNIDLVITGSQQKSPLDRLTKGTNTMDLSITINKPIMEIPLESDLDGLSKVCLCADDEMINQPKRSLSFIKDLVEVFDSHLTVLHVRKSGEEGKLSNDQFNKLHEHLGSLSHEHYSIINNDIFEGITHYLSKYETNLLVAAPRDRGFLESIFHESITEKMLYNTKTPILILPD